MQDGDEVYIRWMTELALAILKKTGVKHDYVSNEPVPDDWKGMLYKFILFNHQDSNFCYVLHEANPDGSPHIISIVLDLGKTKDGPIDILAVVRILIKARIKSIKECEKMWDVKPKENRLT